MDYSEARDAFFGPRSGEATPLPWSTPARRLRDAMEPIATICFWSEPAYDAYAARGLDFLGGYVWGRASTLGEPEPGLVAAAFGVFEPGLVRDVYAASREACPLSDVREAKAEGARTALHAVLGDPADADGLIEVCEALESATEAVPLTGRPFFSAMHGLPVPADGWERLWQATTRLRELRGDTHLAAVVTERLDGVQANVLTERWIGWEPLAYTGSRAWSPERMEQGVADLEARGLVQGEGLSDAGRALRERLEQVTDDAMQPVVDALDASRPDLDTLVGRLDGWAQQVVDHGWFPPDPYKRAAG